MEDLILFLQSVLTTALASYKTTNSTNITAVTVVADYSSDKKISGAEEETLIQCVYREMTFSLPKSAVKDAVKTGTLFITAPDSERACVRAVFQYVIDNYQSRQNEDFIFYFVPLSPIGAPQNNGYVDMQSYTFGITYIFSANLTTIFDRSVAFGSNAITALNGLLYLDFVKQVVSTEAPVGTSTIVRTTRYVKYTARITMLDVETSTDVQNVKGYIYDDTLSVSMTIVSGSESITFTGTLTESHDSISDSGFPLLTFTVESGA